MQAVKIDCYKCKYYYVTWEPKFPKGCKLYGFKSAEMPSAVVRGSTGEVCRGFAAKQTDEK